VSSEVKITSSEDEVQWAGSGIFYRDFFAGGTPVFSSSFSQPGKCDVRQDNDGNFTFDEIIPRN